MARRDDLRVTRMCRAVLKKHGVTLKIVQREPWYNWDGTGVLRNQCDAEMVSHDTAHYLVARTEDRELPEFGLGGSTWARMWCPPTTELCNGDIDDTEAQASLLGIKIVALINRSLAAEQYEDHGWCNTEYKGSSVRARKMFRRLIDAGHLTWHHGKLVPTEFIEFLN